MSMIDEKYRGKPKLADWPSKFIDTHAMDPVTKVKTVTAEDGTKTESIEETGKLIVNLPNLIALAKANNLNVEKYDSEDEQAKKNAPGRLRMTIGNMLRAAARKRHGLNDLEGNFQEADALFIGENPKTHNPDGSKIAPAKTEAAPAEGEAATA